MPSLGLSLGLGGVRVLGAAGPALDPDAAAWFEAVEATGATFGPDSATVDANKAAWSNWVKAQKNAESPIAGRSNWQQLTEPGEGYIQPLMGVSTFNIPAMFGNSTFTSFVSGDYLPALGLKGGTDRVLLANRDWDNTPQNDFSAGMWITGAASLADGSRILGNTTTTSRTLLLNDARSMAKSTEIQGARGDVYTAGTFPRSAFLSRSSGDEYTFHNGLAYTISSDSDAPSGNTAVSMFATPSASGPTDVRSGLAFYGRSINLEAMNAACVALSEAITWP